MPYSTGTYTPASPQYPFIAGSLIVAADMNTVIADIAAALSVAWPRDGQAPPTANMPMGGFRFTGAGDAIARDQFVTYGQLQDTEANWADVATGTANAVAIAISPAIPAYEDGQMFYFPVTTDNTLAVTLAVNGLAAIAVEKDDGSGNLVALAAGDWQAGTIVVVMMENAKFQWLNKNDRGAVQLATNQTITGTKTVTGALDLSGASSVLLKNSMIAQGAVMINGTLVASVAGSALTIELKTLAGTNPSATDPVYVAFRSATAANADYTILTVTAAQSIVVSNGSTLGAANNIAFRPWIVAFNDAGTFRLGIINCTSTVAAAGAGRYIQAIYPLSQFGIASSIAEGGAGGADSAQAFYTGTAVASKAYTTLGYVTFEAGLAAVGTYGVVPTRGELVRIGSPLPGRSLQQVFFPDGAQSNGATALPDDDTIPQSGEGNQLLTLGILPTSAANALRVKAQALLSNDTISVTGAALFQDATANALVASRLETGGAAGQDQVCHTLYMFMLSQLSVTTTFKVRGGGSSGTTTYNGRASARKYGGVLNSYIEIEEIMC